MCLSVPGRGLKLSCSKHRVWGRRNDSLQIFSKNEKTQTSKVNTECLILVNATKLKCLYIETREFEVKTTLWEEKRKALFAHIEWMSLSLFWFSFEIDVGFVGMCETNQPRFVGLPIMEG